ncbi:Ig-like domain-containing protein [Anaerolineales bacterium HSG25]|nr:Ig-like domain-containing protein [Anaerolineales bacterium HSG25]
MRKKSHIIKIVVLFGLLLSLLPAQDVTQAAGPTVQKFTFPNNFAAGEAVNVEAEGGSLQMTSELSTFPFIWIALSGRGTVAKLDTETGEILAEYKTAPDNRGKNPSRTTVDLNGNVWLSNRSESSGGKGSVTHFGLLENNQCVDRNENGVIDTSTGLDDVKAWPKGNDNGGVTNAADECIIHYVRTNGTGVRHVSLDINGDVWAGGWSIKKFDLIDGQTGQIKKTAGPFSYGGYGGLIDGNNVLWSAHPNGKLLRYDTNTGDTTYPSVNAYGLGLDSQGNVWAGPWGSKVVKVAPDGSVLGKYHDNSIHRGVAVDSNDEVWVVLNYGSWSRTQSKVVRLDNDGNTIATIDVGTGATGAAVDSKGKVWVTNYGSHNVSRIDPTTNEVDKTVYLGKNAAPYNYSDMTGALALNNTAPQGTWITVIDQGVNDTTWDKVSWEATTGGGSEVELSARVANTKAGLGGKEPVILSSGGDISLKGRYMQLQVKLKPGPAPDKTSPTVTSIDVTYTNSNSSADDAPTLTAAGSTSWTRGGKAVVVDADLTVTGSSDIDGAKVSIGENFKASEDSLGIEGQSGGEGTVPGGIEWDYDEDSGIMTLSGTSSTANYQAALRKVTYNNNNSNSPSEAARKIDFTLGTAIAYADNGHFYEYVASNGITWYDAKETASGSRLYGLKGYLGTMTSEGENSFVQEKVSGYAWIGGSDEESEGTWKWVTGPEAGTTFWQGEEDGSPVDGNFTAWKNKEPNNDHNTGEHHLHFYDDKEWNDFYYDDSSIKGYVVEYGSMPNDPELNLTGQVTVNISANPPPTAIKLSADTIAENAPVGRGVGRIEVVDPGDNVHIITLADGPGNTDNDSFTLRCGRVFEGGTVSTKCTLLATATFDYEKQDKLKILVRAVDPVGGSKDQKFIINVTNVDEAPVVVKEIEPDVVDENPEPNPKVIDVTDHVKDPDGDTLTYEATSSNEALVKVTITAEGKLSLAYEPDQVGTSTITVKVTANGKTTTTSFDVTVTRVINRAVAERINKAVPTIKEDGSYAAVSVAGLFIADAGETFKYSAKSDNETLVTASVEGTTLSLDVKADQSGEAKITITGTSDTRAPEYVVVVKVLPVNDKPSFDTLGDQKMAEWGVDVQTVAGFAKDFNPGPANESDQSVDGYIVTVMGEGKELFETLPKVDNEGTLTYKPSGAAGTTDVKLVVRDNGGIDNGGVNESEAKTFSIEIPRSTGDLVVRNLNDDGPDSLRYVLRYIGEGKTITFDPEIPQDGSILLESQLCIDVNVTIDGENYNISLSGQNKYRVLCIHNAIDVTIKGVNIVDGYTPKEYIEALEGDVGGGGILVSNEKATLTLEDCTIANNKSDYEGGAIDGYGSLTIRRCVIRDNQSGDYAGGIYWGGIYDVGSLTIEDSKLMDNEASGRGGALYTSYVVLKIIDSELSGNKAKTGGGFFSDEFEEGSFEVIRSTLVKNVASSWGGGFLGDFGKVYNSTISENEAGGAGAFADAAAKGQEDDRRLIEIYGSTIYGNKATLHTNSGGISSYFAKIELRNSIVAGNTRSGEAGSVELKNYINENSGTLVSNGNNISDSSLGITAKDGDKFNLDLETEIKLADLGYYGSPIQRSHPPLAGSKAVDNGDNTTCNEKQDDKDQMGNTRPQKGNPNSTETLCDIGAVEIQGAWPKVSEVTPTNGDSDIADDARITVKFSEDVEIDKDGLELACPAGQPMAVTITKVSSTEYILTPVAGLPNGVTCRVTVYADKVTDEDSTIPGTGNLSGNYTSDFTTIPAVRISMEVVEGNEDEQTELKVYAIASAPLSGRETVDVGVTGTGIETTDYTLSSDRIAIEAGSKQGFIIFTIKDDNFAENEETATLTLINKTEGIVLDSANSVDVTISDNDNAGLDAPAAVGFIEGDEGTFKIKLTSEPATDVEVALSNPDTGVYTTPATVALNSTNWDTGAVVTVTTDASTGDVTSPLSLLLTGDASYDGMTGTVKVNIKDKDTGNIVLSRYSFNLTEGHPVAARQAGSLHSDTFVVRLTTDPKNAANDTDVTVAFASTNARCTVLPATGTLNKDNRTEGITVTVTTVRNRKADGHVDCPITTSATSTDADYEGEPVDNVTVKVFDDDTKGIIVEAGDSLSTSEDDPTKTATFTIKLTSEPTGTVTIPFTTDDPTEGTVTEKVEIEPADWDKPVTVIVSGVDDNEQDGAIDYTVIISAAVGGGYDGLEAGGDAESHKPGTGVRVTVVWVTNQDNDSIDFNLSKLGGLETTEAGGSDTFTLKLNTQPFAPITVTIESSNLGEGVPDSSELTFNEINWNTVQTIKVTGVDDRFEDGNVPYTLTLSVDPSTEDTDYKDIVRTIGAVNEDMGDTPGVTVVPTELVVDETGVTKTFTIKLNSRPSSNVAINLEPSNGKAGKVSPTTVTFTPDNWDTEQTATVTGLHDKDTPTDVTFEIETSIGLDVFDKEYASLQPDQIDNVSVTSGNKNLPTPVDDTDETLAELSVTIDVLSNDTDLTEAGVNDTANLTIDAIAGQPAFGTATIVDGKVEYNPALDFSGTDSFTYTVKDSEGYTSEGVVSVEVFPLIASANVPAFTDPGDGSSALTAPADGSSTAGLRPTFEWWDASSNAGIAYYEITLEPMPADATEPLTSTTTTYTPPFDLVEGTTYEWTVKAYDSADVASNPILPRASFNVTAKTTPDIYLPIIVKPVQ